MSTSDKSRPELLALTFDQFNLGSKFLIWSINYLSGQNDYFFERTQQKLELPESPLLNNTAHGMKANYVFTIPDFRNIIENRITSGTELAILKYQPRAASEVQYHEKNRDFHEFARSNKIKTVNTTCKGNQHLIGFLRGTYEKKDWQSDLEFVGQHCKHYWPDFFHKKEMFSDNLETFHDIREAVAFNIRFDHFWQNYIPHNPTLNLLQCQFEDLVLQGDTVMERILDFLGMPIDHSRLTQWKVVHLQWQKKMQHYVMFCNDVELIASNIAQNRSMDLTPYKMDVLKEGLVLHLLMYKHDLNFQASIDKLPENTKDIGKFLHKNHRTGIENLYNML